MPSLCNRENKESWGTESACLDCHNAAKESTFGVRHLMTILVYISEYASLTLYDPASCETQCFDYSRR